MKKICSKCGVEKPIDCFHKDGIRGRHGWCKDCYNANRKSRKAYGTNEQRRKWNYSGRYGLSVEDVQKLLDEQENKCAICGEKLTRYCIDHDHITGRVRGILCHRCNIRIGGWDDDDWKAKAMGYLGL